MVPADLAARLEAAGLPTDLEGMLEAAVRLASNMRFSLTCHWDESSEGEVGGWYWDCDGKIGYRQVDGDSSGCGGSGPAEAVARWLLAAKEAHRG